jgi:hypothetical protein
MKKGLWLVFLLSLFLVSVSFAAEKTWESQR